MIRPLFWLLFLARSRAWKARRAHRSGWFLFYTALAATADALVVVMAALWLVVGFAIGELPLALVMFTFMIVFMCPLVVVDRVLVPLGWHRAAWLFTMTGHQGDRRGRGPAQLNTARALARAGAPAAGVAWLRARPRSWAGADDLAAEAILAQAGGSLDDAHRLFASLALVRDPAPEARELASEWLALDDARAGRWDPIVARGAARVRPTRGAHRAPAAIKDDPGAVRGEPLWPATTTTYFLEGVAGRLLGHGVAPSRLGLWLRWLETPHRRRTWPLLQRARAAPVRLGPPIEAGPATGEDPVTPSLAVAVRAHAAAVRSTAAAPIAAAARAWDPVLDDPAWRTEVLGRAAALGAPADAGTRVLADLRDQVVGDLAAVILDGAIALPPLARAGAGSPVLAAAAARARHELLARLELAVARVGTRIADDHALPAIDEWRSFLAVHAEYAAVAAQGGLELERLAFPHVHSELTAWAVWLWNQRQQYTLSHALTSWLYERALAVGDAEAIELHGKNGAISAPDA